MRFRLSFVVGSVLLTTMPHARAQSVSMSLPKQVRAGDAFSIQTTGSGKATLYIVGFGGVLRQELQLGGTTSIAAGVLHNAGQYLATLVGESSRDEGRFDVIPASQVANVSFLAKPSRLSVGLHNGISGAVYIFDANRNLITAPTPVSFQLSGVSQVPQLSGTSGVTQVRTATARNGCAWTQMDSAAKEGNAQFAARVGDVSATRIIQEVPGDPCGLRMSARPSGQKIELETDPLRDCSGNAVPDGTVVTFTEVYDGKQTTVDVPLKRGIAQVELPAYNGAKISAATGVVLGNEIRWGKQ
jgi:hypothetical protein